MNGNDCHLSSVHFLLPKAGLLSSECEDAIAFCHRQRRYCIADGATEAFDSRRWAKFLTKCWAAHHRHRLLTKEEFEPWLAILGNRLEQRWGRRPLPWYAEEKARSGAFAAFVGVAFIGSEHGLVWQAVALGDSCLIHIRDNLILQALPINEPKAFGYHPTLISRPRNDQENQHQLLLQQGRNTRVTRLNAHYEFPERYLSKTRVDPAHPRRRLAISALAQGVPLRWRYRRQ
jgi:hypothetical protein